MHRDDPKRTITLAAIAIVCFAATAYFLLERRWLAGLTVEGNERVAAAVEGAGQ